MLLLASLLLQTTAPMAMPMDKPVACPARPAPLPTALAGWTTMTPVVAGTTAATAPTLVLGRSARAALRAATAVTLPLPVGKAAAAGSSSGVFAFDVPAAGRYRIVLGAGVWVDVGTGAVVASVAHGHGPACSTVRKTVDFDLKPGRHLLQVVGSAAPTLALMVAPVR